MIDELYFSVSDLKDMKNAGAASAHLTLDHRTNLKEKKLGSTSAELYMWAIWDIYPSPDVMRPPILSGLTSSKDHTSDIAKQYGLDNKIIYDNNHHFNENISILARRAGTLISYQKRSNKYVFAAWDSAITYLCNNEPIYLNENVPEDELLELILKHSENNPYAGHSNGGFVKNYIRKREAEKLFSSPPRSNSDAILVEFIYANHLELHCTPKTQWKKHRVIKKTENHIFIDKYPFCGESYLRQGWQARVTYTIMLNRKNIEENNEHYHKSFRMHFFTKKIAKLKSRSFFKKDSFENEVIYEVPENGVQWALNLLGISEWPTTAEIVSKAFRVSAMKYHPDRGGTAEMFVKCKTAQEFLMDRIP
ncbi:MAG: hypothetical protein IV103_09805 [Zoogloea sp.]|nr:hypothetical protein [Zoogloea sp.]